MDLSLVIPVYNEERTIDELIGRVLGADTFGLEKELVLVDDCSCDGTRQILKKYQTGQKTLYHEKNQGKGAALRRGFKEVALVSGVSVASDGNPRAGMGTDFGDYDNDGKLDLFVTNHELEAHTLFRNLGKALFEDATFPSGVGSATLPYVGFGADAHSFDGVLRWQGIRVRGRIVSEDAASRHGAEPFADIPLVESGPLGEFLARARPLRPRVEQAGLMSDVD